MIRIHLSRLLGERKWNQADLVRKTGIRANTISALFNEFADRVSLKQLEDICEVLGCDLHDLLEYVPSASKSKRHNSQQRIKMTGNLK